MPNAVLLLAPQEIPSAHRNSLAFSKHEGGSSPGEPPFFWGSLFRVKRETGNPEPGREIDLELGKER